MKSRYASPESLLNETSDQLSSVMHTAGAGSPAGSCLSVMCLHCPPFPVCPLLVVFCFVPESLGSGTFVYVFLLVDFCCWCCFFM